MPNRAVLVRACTSPPRFAWVLPTVLVACVAVIAVGGFVIVPEIMKTFGDDCPGCDERAAEAYLFEALPKWRHEHTAACPTSLAELSPYIGDNNANDEWGDPIELTCDANHAVVHMRGEDRLANTADDFWRTFP